jgi:hypothetical protein
VTSSLNEVSNTARPWSFSTGTPTDDSGSARAVVVNPVPAVTKTPFVKSVSRVSWKAISPRLLIDGRESEPVNWLVDAR